FLAKHAASKRVCVIGAGPAGMSTLIHFAKLPEMPDVVCYEKQDTCGGLWNFTWITGVDQCGELCHSGIPKECCEFIDYTFQKHFGHDIGTSFPSREMMLVYLKGNVKLSFNQRNGRWTNNAGRDLEQYITYSTVVRSVIHTEKTEMFTVTVNDLRTGAIRTEQFTHVVIACGILTSQMLLNFWA
ncbi:GSOX1-like protein, partial [Mya arenaria]